MAFNLVIAPSEISSRYLFSFLKGAVFSIEGLGYFVVIEDSLPNEGFKKANITHFGSIIGGILFIAFVNIPNYPLFKRN